MTGHKINSADTLPPIDVNFIVFIGDVELTAKRTDYIKNRGDMLEYELSNGDIVCGKFRWRYL